MGNSLIESLFIGLAEADALRKRYGPVCKSCFHNHSTSDRVIKKRTNRSHDATTWLVFERDPSVPSARLRRWPFCDKHARSFLLKNGWTALSAAIPLR